jgi:hypothetical protein
MRWWSTTNDKNWSFRLEWWSNTTLQQTALQPLSRAAAYCLYQKPHRRGKRSRSPTRDPKSPNARHAISENDRRLLGAAQRMEKRRRGYGIPARAQRPDAANADRLSSVKGINRRKVCTVSIEWTGYARHPLDWVDAVTKEGIVRRVGVSSRQRQDCFRRMKRLKTDRPSMQRYPKEIALQVGLGENECRSVGPGRQRHILDHPGAW